MLESKFFNIMVMTNKPVWKSANYIIWMLGFKASDRVPWSTYLADGRLPMHFWESVKPGVPSEKTQKCHPCYAEVTWK